MTRILKTIPLLLVMFFALVGPALAQSSWLPSYNSSQRIYIAPGVDASVQQTYSSSTWLSDLNAVSRVHDLDVYVIITASGNDSGNDARQAGPVLVRKLWDHWTNNVGFNSDRALIILMTGDGRALTSVGVRAGDFLNRLGIQRSTMNDQSGPVIPVLRAYLTSDPASIPARIVGNINTIVTSKTTPPATLSGGNQPTSGTTEGDNSMGFGTILLIASGIILVVGAFIVATRPRRPDSTYTSTRPTARTTSLRKPGSGFEGRLSDSRRRNSGTAAGTGVDVDDDTRRRNDNDGINTATAAGAGVVAGVLIADAARREDEPRRDSGSSDSGYVAPVSAPSCSTPSAPSCSSSSGSSCSSSSGSSCGGGGGGGCGGGGS